MIDSQILKVAKSKVKDLYQLTDAQLQRVADLFILESVQPFKSERHPDSFYVISASDPHKKYCVNISELTCQCKDWQNHNQGEQETIHLCKHVLACFLYRHYHAALEIQAREQPWEVQLDKLIQHAMG